MGLLSKIVQEDNVQESEEYVSTGSKKYEVSGTHVMTINMAKMIESQGGAIGLSLELEDEDGVRVFHTIYMTTKEQKPYYITKDGDKKELPGYTQVKSLNYLINGTWSEPEGEEKQVKEYNWNTRKEEFANREVITSFIGKQIGVCIEVKMEDSWKDNTKPITKVEPKHFFDPVTEVFASEKKAGKDAENKAKFDDNAEKTPVLDKRKMSKGVSTSSNPTVSKESLGF